MSDTDIQVDHDDVFARHRVLVVDDSPTIRAVLSSLLSSEYEVILAANGVEGLQMAQRQPAPDLMLLDVEMPGMDGFEVCRHIKADANTSALPVIFLTSLSSPESEGQGLSLGAADYITKPISAPILLARVANHLALKRQADFLRSKADFLSQEVERRTQEISAVQDVTILAMASMAETRDNETGNHIRRTQHYIRVLAEALKDHPRFSRKLKPGYVRALFKSAPLHDIGKVGIPDRILLKPGRLSPDEFEIMKSHTTLGRDAIVHAEQSLGVQVGFLTVAKEIAYSHQEKWDGSGYPEGLQGESIPLSARLMAVADVYDALISERVYKKAMSHEQAVRIMREGRATHFDPDILDAFLRYQDRFLAIARRYADSSEELDKKVAQAEQALGPT